MIARIEDKNGNVLENFLPAQRKEIISEATAYSVNLMMQGVVQQGTGRRMAEYGLEGEIAGKTGTTNDNSDAWFIGFTPQLLAGAWVGCDDRFIRFNSDIGQGSAAALPVWAYFFNKAFNDKTLGLDKNAQFSKPESLSNDIIFDYQHNIDNYSEKAEGEDMGNGSSDDYIIPEGTPEEIGAESEVSQEKAKAGAGVSNLKTTPTPPAKVETAPAEVDMESLTPRERRKLRRQQRREGKNNQEEEETPKAVMPKKPDQ
jgi:penicillin-binding protein 1A